MSINFTSDIDGATSGSGIKKITVGGKTINLSEVSSGGGEGVLSGSFTPSDKELTHTIEMGRECKNFFFHMADTSLDTGYRTYMGGVVTEEVPLLIASTNATGGNFAYSFAGTTSNLIAALTIDGSTVTLQGNADTSPGYLAPKTYYWYAW